MDDWTDIFIDPFWLQNYSSEIGGPSPEPTYKPSEPTPPPSKTLPPQLPAQPFGEPAPPPKDVKALPPNETYFTHTVKWNGETVSIIAAWYTGYLENWKALAEVMTKNDPKANINCIFLGNKILIPKSLMKTRDPMPKEFVDSFYQKSKPERVPSKPEPSQTEKDEPKLFGPRELPKK